MRPLRWNRDGNLLERARAEIAKAEAHTDSEFAGLLRAVASGQISLADAIVLHDQQRGGHAET